MIKKGNGRILVGSYGKGHGEKPVMKDATHYHLDAGVGWSITKDDEVVIRTPGYTGEVFRERPRFIERGEIIGLSGHQERDSEITLLEEAEEKFRFLGLKNSGNMVYRGCESGKVVELKYDKLDHEQVVSIQDGAKVEIVC